MADKKPRALVIDNNSANLDVLTQLLLIEGCACNRLSNVDDLSAELDKLYDVSVVFLDLHLPRMNGYEALKNFRIFSDAFSMASMCDISHDLSRPCLQDTSGLVNEH